MTEESRLVTIVDNRLWKSVGRDVFSFVTLAAAIGLGVLLESEAMQWIGAIVWFLSLFARAASIRKTRHTIAEARALLDEMEQEK